MTAIDFMNQYPLACSMLDVQSFVFCEKMMIEFAKLHVKAQNEIILDNVRIIVHEEIKQFSPSPYVDKESILNSYPLTNIK